MYLSVKRPATRIPMVDKFLPRAPLAVATHGASDRYPDTSSSPSCTHQTQTGLQLSQVGRDYTFFFILGAAPTAMALPLKIKHLRAERKGVVVRRVVQQLVE